VSECCSCQSQRGENTGTMPPDGPAPPNVTDLYVMHHCLRTTDVVVNSMSDQGATHCAQPCGSATVANNRRGCEPRFFPRTHLALEQMVHTLPTRAIRVTRASPICQQLHLHVCTRDVHAHLLVYKRKRCRYFSDHTHEPHSLTFTNAPFILVNMLCLQPIRFGTLS
jgi:hypothetical protein